MQKILRFFLFFALTLPAFADRDIGEVKINSDAKTVPIRVSSASPELNALANQAFSTHGRYRVVGSGYSYDIKFTPVGSNQVKVDIVRTPSGTPVSSDVATGTNLNNALLRAADIAVEKTNGLGLKGYFAGKIAFIGERTGKREVYTSDLFFRETKQITHDNALAMTPRWSPDGNKIIYTSYFKSGFPDIFVLNLSTFQRTTFVSFKGTNSSARYSPDGSRVAMVLSGEGNPEIYVSDANGRGVSRKTRNTSVEASPAWSPDGSKLVFTSDAAGGPQLYVMPSSGGSMQRIGTAISKYCAEPDWSRGNPNKIAFTIGIGGGYQVAMYDFSAGKSEQVSHAPFDGVEPSWLADGRHLIYTARTRTASRLCILDTETGKSTPISPTAFGLARQASVWGQ